MLPFRDTNVLTATSDDLMPHAVDWIGRWTEGKPPVVVFPTSTAQVSGVLSYCREKRFAVVPQGGNTGLVGGSIPVHDEIVLSLSKMNNILDFDENNGVLKCEAGCILQALDEYAATRGFAMPLDLGAKGSCQIGGNVSTHAGGIRYVRYGSLKDTVMGMEVVLASGQVLDLKMKTALRKDNTGYDLKQLFIGAEGTLGVVTKVAVRTAPRPTSVHLALLGVPSFEAVRKTFADARANLGEILSAIEFMDGDSFEFGRWDGDPSSAKLPSPFGEDVCYPFYVLVETSGTVERHDREKLDAFLERWMTETMAAELDDGLVDGVVAQDQTQAQCLWHIRESIASGCVRRGLTYKYDLSLPMDKMYEIVDILRERLSMDGGDDDDRVLGVVGYGHLGDCNLHLNVVVPEHDPEVFDLLEPFLFDWTTTHKGSISAEHGVGQCKNEYLSAHVKPAAEVALMRAMKSTFDPDGILNPYKVLRDEGNGVVGEK
eukprot:g3768.t1